MSTLAQAAAIAWGAATVVVAGARDLASASGLPWSATASHAVLQSPPRVFLDTLCRKTTILAMPQRFARRTAARVRTPRRPSNDRAQGGKNMSPMNRIATAALAAFGVLACSQAMAQMPA